MNYYISGQSGFIGTAITKYLVAKGESVHNIPRNYHIEGLVQIFDVIPPDYIIHLSSYGNHYGQDDCIQMINTNITGTYNLLEAASGFDYKKFYNFSSSSVGLFTQTPYSITKRCGEQLADRYKRTVNIRPYSVYGIGEPLNKFIPTVIRKLKNGELMVVDENATHDWIYIDDLIDALFLGYTDIGSGIKLSNKEIILLLEHISGKKLSYIHDKLRDYDNESWVAEEGYSGIGIYEGLKKTYDNS